MKNINLLINILMDIMEFEGLEFERINIDDGGATEEAEVAGLRQTPAWEPSRIKIH